MIAGGVVVAFSTWSTADELDWLLQDSGASTLIALDRFGDNDFAAALRRLVPEAGTGDRWRSARYPTLRDIVLLGDSYDRLREGTPMAGRLRGSARVPQMTQSSSTPLVPAAGPNRYRCRMPASLRTASTSANAKAIGRMIASCSRRRCSGPTAVRMRCPPRSRMAPHSSCKADSNQAKRST
jgi:hypothetical protein